MDGQRRIAQPVIRNKHFRRDCAAKYRVMARGFALLFLAISIVRGVIVGGHLDYPGSPWLKMPGQVAGLFGLAAIDIEMAGLQHHDPEEVLNHIGVRPGGPIVGFDAKKARAKLQELDWVDSATVVRRFPNQLQITISEREPFVVWQHDGKLEVVDQKGKPMTGISASTSNMLLHVVGDGANMAASQLVNQMEATPGLFQEMRAAVRVGDRRWDLYMNNGLVIQLPEQNLAGVLKLVEADYLSSRLQGKALERIDFRIAQHVSYFGRSVAPTVDPTTTSSIQ